MASATAPRLPDDWTATQWRGQTRQLDQARKIAEGEGLKLSEVLRMALGLFLDIGAPTAGRCGRCGRRVGAGCDCRPARRSKVAA